MNLLIIGNNDGPLRLLKSLKYCQVSIVGVGLQKPVSRQLMIDYKNIHIEGHFFVEFNNERGLKAKINSLEIDLIVNCFSNIIFKRIINIYPVLNIHLSILPAYKGRHPLHWALINGEKEIGFSIHKMTKDIDGGEIYWQHRVSISEGLSVVCAREKLMLSLEKDFANFLLKYLNYELNITPNSMQNGFYISRRYPEDSVITEWHDRNLVFRKVMALSSEDYPAAIIVNGTKVEVRNAKRPESVSGEPGKVSRLLPDGIEVECGNGNIILKGFSPEDYSLAKNQNIS